jgi:hypothetical protein
LRGPVVTSTGASTFAYVPITVSNSATQINASLVAGARTALAGAGVTVPGNATIKVMGGAV